VQFKENLTILLRLIPLTQTASVIDEWTGIRRTAILLCILSCTFPLFATTWYVRSDGGTRYSAARIAHGMSGQCNGKYDDPYPGSGVNQNCAFNDWRFLYDDQVTYGALAWVITGGDTVILRGGPWRSGRDTGLSNDAWCNGRSAAGCFNPTIPAGTSAHHTKILGENYANCSDGRPTATGNQTQLFGGFGSLTPLNLKGAQYVDVQCLEITRHSQCTKVGSAGLPSACHTSSPYDDFSDDGAITDVNTHDVLLQDLWIHGMMHGIIGPVGGVITAERVNIGFNGFDGWEFDDGNGTPSVNGLWKFYDSTIEFSGCVQEYPITHAIPALYCYSQSYGGYGDAVGSPAHAGLSTDIQRSVFRYNVQDAIDLGHVDTCTNCTFNVSNSLFYGNEGQSIKWGPAMLSTTVTNNLINENCMRMSQPMTGAPSTYNTYLGDFCRSGGGSAFSWNFNQEVGQSVLIAQNTIINESSEYFVIGCNVNSGSSCSQATQTIEDNIFVGYDNPATYSLGNQPGGPALWYCQTAQSPNTFIQTSCTDPTVMPSLVRENNIFYKSRPGLLSCPTGYSGELCANPEFVSQPVGQGKGFVESELDIYTNAHGFAPGPGSPAIQAGVEVKGITDDYNGNKRPIPPSIGAEEPDSKPLAEPLSLEVSPDLGADGEPVKLTAIVAQTGKSIPTGSVTFFNARKPLGTAIVASNGTATLDLGGLAIGSYALVAKYSGDSNHEARGTDILAYQVLSQSTTDLSTSSNSLNFEQSLTITAHVLGKGTASPAGYVTIWSDSTALGTTALDASGTARITTNSLPVGELGLAAQYSGSGAFFESKSSVKAVSVKPQPTTTALKLSSGSTTYGTALSLTVTVKGTGSALPTGTITYFSGTTILGTATVSASGVATVSVKSLPAGSDGLKAQYSGGGNFLGSTSPVVTVTVKPKPTTTIVVASPGSIIFGTAFTLTATVKGIGSAPLPGIVTFLNGSASLGTATVSNAGVATMNVKGLSVGSHVLKAVYSGGGNFLGSTSSPLTLTVKAQATTITLVASPASVTFGKPFVLTATVKGTGVAASPGTVTYLNGSTTLGTASVSASGIAILNVKSLPIGSHTLTARFSGSANFLASVSTGAALKVTK
jgi:Bacterial Ig-like domain (group 3)